MNNHISNQGSAIKNPNGYMVWNIGSFLTGFLFIPHFLYIHTQIEKNYDLKHKYLKYFGVICCLGHSFVGIFPEEQILPHQFFASIYFLGIQLLFNIDYALLLRTLNFSKNKKKVIVLHVIQFYFNVSFVLALIFISLKSLNPVPIIDARFFNFPVWEWNLYISGLLWLFGIVFLI